MRSLVQHQPLPDRSTYLRCARAASPPWLEDPADNAAPVASPRPTDGGGAAPLDVDVAAGACLVDSARCFARARAPLRAMERYSTRHSSSVACYLLPYEVMLATTPSTITCTTQAHMGARHTRHVRDPSGDTCGSAGAERNTFSRKLMSLLCFAPAAKPVVPRRREACFRPFLQRSRALACSRMRI